MGRAATQQGRKPRSRSRAQNLVEFAIVLPIFLGAVLGVFEMGRLMAVQAQLINGVAAAARAAVIKDNPYSTVLTQAKGQMTFLDTSAVNISITDTNGTTVLDSVTDTRATGSKIKVTGTYTYNLFPAFATLVKAGSGASTFNLSHSAVMTVE